VISLWDPWHGGLYPHLPVCRRSQCGHSGGIGWKPGVGRLERALGLQGGDAGGDGFGQVAPAVDLLHDSDEDALADGHQPDLGKVGCRTGRLPGRGAGPGCSGQHRRPRRFGAWRRGRRAQASFCADLTEWRFPLRKPHHLCMMEPLVSFNLLAWIPFAGLHRGGERSEPERCSPAKRTHAAPCRSIGPFLTC